MITAGLSAIFGIYFGLADVSRIGEGLLWFVMPVSTVTAAAYVIGKWIWRRTQQRQVGFVC